MAEVEIQEEIEVGAIPGGNGIAPKAGKIYKVRALSDTEYVSGNPLEYYLEMPRALDWSLDDVSRDFGRDIYDRMMLDPQCQSVVNVLKTSVIETGLGFRTSVQDKDADGYADAAGLVDEVEHMWDAMDTDPDQFLWSMLDCMPHGYKMSELVFDLETVPTGTRRYSLQRLDPKPREATLFVVDPFNHVKGVLAAIPGNAYGLAVQGEILINPEQQTNLLPRSKFAILSFRPRDNDPRGTSILRAGFSSWQQKMALMREWVRYLTQFASPSLIGFTPENAQPYAILGVDGDPVLDSMTGEPVMRNPEADMVAALEAFANGTATAFPFGAVVKAIEMSGDGSAFANAYKFWDMQIAKAVLNQTLATEQSDHQTRASSGTHKDILDTLTLLCKRPVERMIRKDILEVWLRLNGRERLIPLLPRVTLGSVEREDQSRLWGATGALFASGYLHPSQYPGVDEMTGLPKRDPPNESGVHVLEQIQVKEDGSTVDLDTNSLPKPKPGQPDTSGATTPGQIAQGQAGANNTKRVKNPSAGARNQAGAGDLSPQGSGKGGDGA